MEFSAEMIAGFLGGEVVGDPKVTVTTLAKIEEGRAGALSFLSNPKYESYIYKTKAAIVIVNETFTPTAPVSATLVKVADAYGCFAKLLELYIANKPQKTGIHQLSSISPMAEMQSDTYVGEFAVICDGVKVGKGVKIYPQVYLGDNVRLGDNVTLYPGVKIYEECVIGNHVVIDAGSIIGADGFGYAPNERGSYDKIPQIGNVIIEDNVNIGANTCIDRATMGATIIHQGVKLDNLIQIGHNASVGANTVAASQLGLAGSSKIGANCMIGGQVGIAGHLTIGDNAKIASKTGISNNVPDGDTQMGYPSMSGLKYHRCNAIFRNLPEMSRKIHLLEKEINRLHDQLEREQK